MKAAIYTRISLDQAGEGLGVQRQLDDCLALADRLGWQVVARFDDNDLSAFNGKTRPGFEAMLDAMRRGEFNALICWHTDRLYRSMKDLLRLIEVADAGAVTIKTVQGGDLDLSNSTGRMVAKILGSVAEQESEHKGERQKRANAQKAAAGKWQTANRCFGYTMSGEPLEPEASMVRRAVANVLNGTSINQIARDWNGAGVKTTLGTTWKTPRVRRLLVNPRYAALKVHRGKVVGPGNWPALIDEDTHRGLVAYLSDSSRVKCTSFERKYVGSRVYRCGVCAGLMRAARPGGRGAPLYRYECAQGQHVARVGAQLDEYVEMVVLRRLGESDIHILFAQGSGIDVGELHTRRAALAARLDELAAMFAEGAIDGSQLRRGTSELRAQLAGVDSVLAEAARTSPAARLLKDGADNLAEHWRNTSADIKGKITDELMTVTVMPAPRGRGFDPDYVRIEWK
jgi:DNA invertase Pin-like site-specific DNA recombinase